MKIKFLFVSFFIFLSLSNAKSQTCNCIIDLDEIAKAKGKSLTAVALAYVLQSQPYMFPIVGGRKVEHLKDNIEALNISFSEEELKSLNSATAFDTGFPHNFIGQRSEDNFLLKNSGHYDYVQPQKPIPGHQ
ncbi:MAG: aldo/keto reductase [Hymenobacter sp.]|nr:MAG: aldo/keto reductase [Hymenobacter sp.]